MRASVRACVRACVCASVRVFVYLRMCMRDSISDCPDMYVKPWLDIGSHVHNRRDETTLGSRNAKLGMIGALVMPRASKTSWVALSEFSKGIDGVL